MPAEKCKVNVNEYEHNTMRRVLNGTHIGLEPKVEGFESLVAHIPPCFAPFLDSNLQQTWLFGLHSGQRPPSVAKWKNSHRGEKQL